MSAAELLSITESMSNMLRRQKYLAMLSVRPLSTCKGLAAWVTALYDFSPVKYTLRYNNGPNCTSYHGRPKSLLSSDDPLSDCLILSSAPTSYVDLELTLIFHLDLPFPRTVDQPEKENTGPWELLY
ncbi:uncharacterized protein LOC128983267 [Macrosteles quadrilineatus]|uniref:uncharacterized protein LOC128983267 n=1 Tax=Macrosteles quadrilineatus TaxID=74068 RepID=UPI0023E240AA|nr:uncharacterized protein LOC128983267 [Macrosteles quadrilineatus]